MLLKQISQICGSEHGSVANVAQEEMSHALSRKLHVWAAVLCDVQAVWPQVRYYPCVP